MSIRIVDIISKISFADPFQQMVVPHPDPLLFVDRRNSFGTPCDGNTLLFAVCRWPIVCAPLAPEVEIGARRQPSTRWKETHEPEITAPRYLDMRAYVCSFAHVPHDVMKHTKKKNAPPSTAGINQRHYCCGATKNRARVRGSYHTEEFTEHQGLRSGNSYVRCHCSFMCTRARA